MFKLLRTIVVFLGINLALMVLVVMLAPERYDWDDENTDSVLLPMGSAREYDFVLLGTSHARTFARGSHEDLDAVLGMTHYNLARGGGGGVVPALVYLEWFYACAGKVDTVVYMVDPYIFFSPQWNEDRYFAEDEPLDFQLLRFMVKHEVSWDTLSNYLQYKFSWHWFKRPEAVWKKKKKRSLSKIDPEAVTRRVDSLYLHGVTDEYLQRYQGVFEQLIALCRANGSRMVFLFPPTLLGEQPGQSKVGAWLTALAGEHEDIVFEDHGSSVLDTQYYYNHDHLNAEGVRHVAETILKPLLQ